MSNQIGSLKMGQKFKKTPAGEIPVDWGVATISDLCQVNPEVIKESTPPDTQLKYIDIASIERTGSISIPKVMEFKDAPSRARRVVKAGDIIVSTVRPYLKAFARITDLSENLIASTGFAVLRARPNVNGGYVYQHVLSDSFVKYLEEKMTGSSYPAVNSSDVAEYQLPVPTTMEQEKIGVMLSDVDTLIDKVTAEIEKTKELKNGLMRQLFTRGIGHNKFQKTQFGQIPSEWEMAKLTDVCLQITDGTHHTPSYRDDGEIPFLRVTDIQDNLVKWDNVKRISNEEHLQLIKRCHPQKGDILFSKNGTIGLVKVVDWDMEFSIFVSICLIRPNGKKIESDYLSRALSSDLILNQAKLRQKRGAIINLHLEEIRDFSIPLPKIEEQRKISQILRDCDDYFESLSQNYRTINNLKKGLINMLLTGKVRVI